MELTDRIAARPCGHQHDDLAWQGLQSQAFRRAWRIAFIKALISLHPYPATAEVLELREILDHFAKLRSVLHVDTYAEAVNEYLEELSAFILLDPCRMNQRRFPMPKPVL